MGEFIDEMKLATRVGAIFVRSGIPIGGNRFDSKFEDMETNRIGKCFEQYYFAFRGEKIWIDYSYQILPKLYIVSILCVMLDLNGGYMIFFDWE